MANIILIKRGQATNVDNLELQEGELAIAYSADKDKATLYAGNGTDKLVLNSGVKQADVSDALDSAKSYTDTKLSELVNGAPAAMDTLKELADAISSNSSVMEALQSAVGNKVDKETGKGLSANDYTTAEKTKLSGIADNANNYIHPSSHSADMITTTTTKQFVSSTEKSIWDSKLSSTSTVDGGTF